MQQCSPRCPFHLRCRKPAVDHFSMRAAHRLGLSHCPSLSPPPQPPSVHPQDPLPESQAGNIFTCHALALATARRVLVAARCTFLLVAPTRSLKIDGHDLPGTRRCRGCQKESRDARRSDCWSACWSRRSLPRRWVSLDICICPHSAGCGVAR